jgi:hypothetical protein
MGIQKEGWCLPKLKPLYSKAIFWNPKNSLKFYGWLWLGLRNLECSCWKAAELLKLQLSWASSAFQLSWTSAELSFLNSSWTWTSTGVQAGSTGVQGKFNWGPERFNWGLGKVQPGSREVQSGSKESSAGVFFPDLTGQNRLNRS